MAVAVAVAAAVVVAAVGTAGRRVEWPVNRTASRGCPRGGSAQRRRMWCSLRRSFGHNPHAVSHLLRMLCRSYGL